MRRLPTSTICTASIRSRWFFSRTCTLTSSNGPAPGYVPGGPNASFAPDSSYTGPRLAPPMDQPPQKSYKDWNTSWPEDSWEVTEPDLGYQSAYVYLLSRFIRPLTYADWVSGHGLTGSSTNIYADPDGDGVCNLMEFAFNLSPEVADKAALPQFQLQSHTVGGQPGRYLTVQFLRQLGNTNLTYVVQASPDLVTWSDVCTAAGTNRPSGVGFVSETG